MSNQRCCILYNLPGENALADELDVIVQVDFIEKNLKEIGYDTYRKGITGNFMNEIAAVAKEKPDFVFNLVESINNKGELCYFIPAVLNMHALRYTGNPLEALFITTSKLLTKSTLKKTGINTPESHLPSEHIKLTPGNKYIVKPVWEDGSLGITGDSVFIHKHGDDGKFDKYSDSHWFIEQYIEGREFNISVISGKDGPEVLPPAEIIFNNYPDHKPRIVDFKAKWEAGSFEYENTIRDFPGENLKPALKKKIVSTALSCWNEFGLKGYARIDMRIDSNDIPFVIEVNANPCLAPDGGVVAAIIAAEIPFTDVLMRIVSDLNN